MLTTNSSLVVPHNLINKYKCVLVNKGFKVFVYIYIYIYKNTQIERIFLKTKKKRPNKKKNLHQIFYKNI